MRDIPRLVQEIKQNVQKVIVGKDDVIELMLVALLCEGHVLIEDVPGVGKTTLASALARSVGCSYRRIQFTPDVLPSDITGFSVPDLKTGAFEYRPGMVMSQIVLADEINRTSPKTQSSLLEVMEERQVTVDGVTRPVPRPFLVLATQNPVEYIGTYPLPEAQLDRFLFRLNVGGLGVDTLAGILTGRRHGTIPAPGWRLSQEMLEQCLAMADRIVLPEAVARWIARLVAASHPDSPEAPARIRTYVRYGASPRAAIALAESARALALLAGRPSVGFEDVRTLVEPVLNHRLILNYQARLDQVTPSVLAEELAGAIDVAGLNLPADVEVKP